MPSHRCGGCIVFCMDFRFHDKLSKFIKAQGLEESGTDIIRLAGSVKNLVRPHDPRDREFLIEQLKVSYDLHKARRFLIVNHEDCGAYGPEDIPDPDEEIAVHHRDLIEGQKMLQDIFPDVQVDPFFIWLDGKADLVV